MSAEVVVLEPSKATTKAVLAQAYAMADRGELLDVVIVATKKDGDIDLSYSGCGGADLATAALVLNVAATKALGLG